VLRQTSHRHPRRLGPARSSRRFGTLPIKFTHRDLRRHAACQMWRR
jgi:hypothetical protein